MFWSRTSVHPRVYFIKPYMLTLTSVCCYQLQLLLIKKALKSQFYCTFSIVCHFKDYRKRPYIIHIDALSTPLLAPKISREKKAYDKHELRHKLKGLGVLK